MIVWKKKSERETGLMKAREWIIADKVKVNPR
jgi:hypothetical protein